ncbi:hypothetical protein G6F50_012938 [Rhizopus delemar]|uniref:Uncharacterized protein n=1 Tax=Rhizopus delemar TaxID=936053 RepID=A0A9P7CI18_9FUNG|nr:hypothetical protein G6F50_012938 [Rhizopus delemar]
MCVHRQQGHAERFGEAVAGGPPAGAGGDAGAGCALRAVARRIRIGAIGDDLAVADLDDALCVLGHAHVMGDDDDGVAFGMQLTEDRHHFLAGFRVECAGRFIGQDHLATIHQRARDRYALLLAAGQLARLVVHAVTQAQPLQQLLGTRVAHRAGAAGVYRWHFHVAARIQIAQQVVALEDETEMLAAQPRQRIRRHLLGGLAVHPVAALGRPVEAAENVHQRRFSRSRRADDGDELTGIDAQRDVLQHHPLTGGGAIGARHPAQFQQCVGHVHIPSRLVGSAAAPLGAWPTTTFSPSRRPVRICTVVAVRRPVVTARSRTRPLASTTCTVARWPRVSSDSVSAVSGTCNALATRASCRVTFTVIDGFNARPGLAPSRRPA